MSSLKLKHSGGNSVIIAAPSSNPASDRTLTLTGDADGTIAKTSDIKIAKLQEATGSDLGGALIFDNIDTATYPHVRLVFALLPEDSMDGYYFNMRFRTGGASGADDTNSEYNFGYQYTYQTDGHSQVSRIDYSYIGLNLTVGSTDSREGVNGIIDIYFNRSADSGFTTGAGGTSAHWQTVMFNESANFRGTSGSASYNNSDTVYHTGFKIYMGTGSSESGGFDRYKYLLYGFKD